MADPEPSTPAAGDADPAMVEHGVADRDAHAPAVVRMADDIARNLPHLSDDDRARAVAAHIRSFWDPRMRKQLARIVTTDPDRVDPVVVAAVTQLAAS